MAFGNIGRLGEGKKDNFPGPLQVKSQFLLLIQEGASQALNSEGPFQGPQGLATLPPFQ